MNNFSLLNSLLWLVYLLIVDSYFLSDHESVNFLMRYIVLQQQSFTWCINQFLLLNTFYFLFPQTFLLNSQISLFWFLNLLSSSNCFQVPDCFLCFCGFTKCCYRNKLKHIDCRMPHVVVKTFCVTSKCKKGTHELLIKHEQDFRKICLADCI